MSKVRNSQLGFSIIEILLISAVLGLLVLTGWYVLKSNREATDSHKNRKGIEQIASLDDFVVQEVSGQKVAVKVDKVITSPGFTYTSPRDKFGNIPANSDIPAGMHLLEVDMTLKSRSNKEVSPGNFYYQDGSGRLYLNAGTGSSDAKFQQTELRVALQDTSKKPMDLTFALQPHETVSNIYKLYLVPDNDHGKLIWMDDFDKKLDDFDLK